LGIAYVSMGRAGNLELERGMGVGGDVVYMGKRRKNSSIVAMHKNAKVEGGVPENQVAEHE